LQLVRSEDQVFKNLLYIISSTVSFTFFHIFNKLGFNMKSQKRKVSSINSDPLDRVSMFLSGHTDLGSVKCFPACKNRSI
jgi:hypothetical protein